MSASDTLSEEQKDSAWVTIAIPVPPARLFAFLQNTERLFRLNPYLDIRKWEAASAGTGFHLEALNEMNGIAYDLDATIISTEANSGLSIAYDKGLKRALEITLQPGSDGSIMTLRERYHAVTAGDREGQLREVDRSLIPWACAIRRYLLGAQRWGWFFPYRWYRERFWLNMRPFHRRIVRRLIWVTILEFVTFLFVFAIYWQEWRRGR